ncbi:unnamed protein product [Rhizoctonia solani]|uniref:Uncharacterized protein n=1 Tax=Rhizoctonia solani TaxID=456999 RepID=A0A8H2X5U2_9AGAM|nr:unnamed protein product [Rhizoctonia solani]CAE6418176.1 unnamed protein product [Rhizoctonia solani]
MQFKLVIPSRTPGEENGEIYGLPKDVNRQPPSSLPAYEKKAYNNEYNHGWKLEYIMVHLWNQENVGSSEVSRPHYDKASCTGTENV